jgi:hypothetical protein
MGPFDFAAFSKMWFSISSGTKTKGLIPIISMVAVKV